MHRILVCIALGAACLAPGAAVGEEVRAIVEAGTAQGTALGSPWQPRPSFNVGLLGLGESGQGFGARLSLQPAGSSGEPWGLSADAVGRLANESPWYLKGIGGVAVAPPGAWWPPRLRVGAEAGVTAIRGGIGLEVGVAATVVLSPFRPQQPEVVLSAGLGILFGFGPPPPAPAALCQKEPSPARAPQAGRAPRGKPERATGLPGTASSVRKPLVATVLVGLETTDTPTAAPQYLESLYPDGAPSASTTASATAPPASGATTATAAPAQGAASSTAAQAAKSLPWYKVAGTSVAAALGFKSDDERAHEANIQRLMEESGRTLEQLRRMELPASTPGLPVQEPGERQAPRAEPGPGAPRAAPPASEKPPVAEPEAEEDTPREAYNPHGQHGAPDHQATVARLLELAKQEFQSFPNARVRAGTNILEYTGINRRPDVWVLDPNTNKVLKVYEAVRLKPDGSLPSREQKKKDEYDRAGIPCHFEPVKP